MGRKRSRDGDIAVVRFMSGDEPLCLARGLRPGDHATVRVDSLSRKGDGVAHIKAHIGPQQDARTYRLEVRRALPGEVVEVALEAKRRTKFAARILKRVVDSEHRLAPPCEHFGERETPGKGCGGCSIQSLAYEAQLEFKRALVEQTLVQAGIEGVAVKPMLGMADPFYYRNKMEYSFGDDRDRRFACGLYPQGWHNEVIPLRKCLLQSEASDRVRVAVTEWCRGKGLVPYSGRDNTGFLRNLVVREGKGTGEMMVELVTSGDEQVIFDGDDVEASKVGLAFGAFARESLGDVITSLYWSQHVAVAGQRSRKVEHHLWGNPFLTERFDLDEARTLMFEIQPQSFFQPNTLQGQNLAALVGRLARECGAGKKILDLYCGAGNLALCVAPFAREVLGVELVKSAVEDAVRNAARNKLSNVAFACGDVGEWLETPEAKAWCLDVDLVLLDPPRAGLMGAAVEHVRAIGAKNIIYVSCNPEALARDLVRLGEVGYTASEAQPVDMFPHTAHIETVVRLERE